MMRSAPTACASAGSCSSCAVVTRRRRRPPGVRAASVRAAGYRRAAQRGFARERNPHRARRRVAHEADRIERLTGRSGGDRNAHARKRSAAREHAFDALRSSDPRSRAADAAFTLRKKAALRIDELVPRSRNVRDWLRRRFAYIAAFIAGASTIGMRAASAAVVTRSSAMPCASFAIEIRGGRRNEHRPALRARDEYVECARARPTATYMTGSSRSATKRSTRRQSVRLRAVMITSTIAPRCTSVLVSAAILYTAMPPHTPSKMRAFVHDSIQRLSSSRVVPKRAAPMTKAPAARANRSA